MTAGKIPITRVPLKAIKELVKQNGNSISAKGKRRTGKVTAKNGKRARAVQSRGA